MSLILHAFVARDLSGRMFPSRAGADCHAERRHEIARVLAAAYPGAAALRPTT